MEYRHFDLNSNPQMWCDILDLITNTEFRFYSSTELTNQMHFLQEGMLCTNILQTAEPLLSTELYVRLENIVISIENQFTNPLEM